MGGQHRSQAIHFDLDAMTTAFPLEDVKRVLEETGRLSKRDRKLPAPTMVYLIIALGLMVSTGAREVLRRLLDKICQREREGMGWLEPASEAAICKARKRVGFEPLEKLFEQMTRPMAVRRTRGAWFHGRRLVTLDGSSLQVQDSSANARAFGRPKTAKRPAAYPLIRFVMLIENGTRVVFGAAMDGWRTSEVALARRVMDRLGKRMLCLADRLFYSYDLWTQAVATGADLLWRVPSGITLPRLKVLPDRSYLSEIHSGKKGALARSAPRIPVRVIEYTIKVGGKVESYRMITTLLSMRNATAMELARLYERRWNIESSLQEMKTWLRGRRVLLRSRLPVLVKQDFYGLLLAYFGVRCLMHEAALEKDIEPTSISFLHALNLVIQRLPEAVAFSPSGQAALP